MNSRLKQIIAAALMLVIVLGVTACNKKTEVTINIKELGDKIVKEGDFLDELTPLENDMFTEIYEDVDANHIQDKVAYVGTGASAEQVVIIEAKNQESAKNIKTGLNKKLQYDIEQNRDYLPDEIPKLEKPVLQVIDKYVVLCVSNNNEIIETMLKDITESK